jgi:hypothetical protein
VIGRQEPDCILNMNSVLLYGERQNKSGSCSFDSQKKKYGGPSCDVESEFANRDLDGAFVTEDLKFCC